MFQAVRTSFTVVGETIQVQLATKSFARTSENRPCSSVPVPPIDDPVVRSRCPLYRRRILCAWLATTSSFASDRVCPSVDGNAPLLEANVELTMLLDALLKRSMPPK